MKSLLYKSLIERCLTALLVLILLTGDEITVANNEIHYGTTLRITQGMTIMEYGNSTILSGGDIDNQGTLIIKGNLINQNATAIDLGAGLFEFSGTLAQSISGPNEFGSLRIANTGAGVTIISGNQKVNTSLKLKSGRLFLGSNNILLGSTAVDSGGSVSSMVVATGSGELQKEFATLTNFTYAVGDTSGTPEYSPVTANFTAGIFGYGNYLGVNLKNQRDPSINNENYLKRYWTLNSSEISNVNCQLTFNFVDADVQGIKDDLYCLKTVPAFLSYNKYSSGNQLTATVTSFSRFTGSNIIDVTPNITAEPNVMHGVTNYDIILQVTELNFGNTNGQITVRIPKDYRWSFTYNPSASYINGKSVNNSVWTYTDDDPYHKFTTNSVIAKGSYSKLGFIAVWNAGQTQGTYTITSQIDSWSGGEIKIDNNVDAEKLDYFIN
jgi:hypothetical protein